MGCSAGSEEPADRPDDEEEEVVLGALCFFYPLDREAWVDVRFCRCAVYGFVAVAWVDETAV